MQLNWYIRIPAWTKNQVVPSGLYSFKKHLKTKVTIRVNGKKFDYRETNGYARIPGKWQAGDEIDLELPMQVRRIETNPLVVNNRGKIALQRGPLVYCLEGIDHNNGFMFDTVIPDQAEIKSRYEKDLLKGVVTLRCRGKKRVKENHRTVEKEIRVKAIPYYTWNNRVKNCGPIAEGFFSRDHGVEGLLMTCHEISREVIYNVVNSTKFYRAVLLSFFWGGKEK